MKLGCCINMFGNEQDPIGSKYIPSLKKAGYDYVEIPLAQIMEISETSFCEFLEKMKEVGLPCLCCNNFFPGYLRLTGERAEFKEVENYIEKAVMRAAALGAEKIVFGSSKAKNVPVGFSKMKAFDQIVEVLKIADSYVKQQGIQIVIEPLNHLESNIIRNLSEGIELMHAENYSSVFLLVDYYHYKMEHDEPTILKKVIKDIHHIHFADPDGRRFPVLDKKEYEKFFGMLREGGYDGGISIEAYSDTPEQDIMKALFIKKYLLKNVDVCKQSL